MPKSQNTSIDHLFRQAKTQKKLPKETIHQAWWREGAPKKKFFGLGQPAI